MTDIDLSELNIIYHTQIEYDNFIIPIKIDIGNITPEDYATAFSFVNQFKKKPIKSKIKEDNELDNIKIATINDGKITLSYEHLFHEYEYEIIEQDKRLNYIFKFVNVSDKLYNDGTQNLLEYLNCENIYDWFLDTGFDDNMFSEMYKTISYWVEMLISEFHIKTKIALLLNDEDGVVMNANLARLKSCYETLGIYYFMENSDTKCYEKLSYREQHLLQSYTTKMYYIDVSLNKQTKKEIEESKKESSQTRKNSRFGRA